MKQRLTIVIIFLLLVVSFAFLWWNQAKRPPLPSNQQELLFTIKSGESIRDIADKLNKERLIRSSVAFFLLVRFSGLADNIQAGDFRLSPSMDLPTLTNQLLHGSVDVQITIPEGWRVEEIGLKLTQELGFPELEFLESAREGYMFPDTYKFPKDITGKEVAQIFIANFQKKIAEIDKSKLTSHDLDLEKLVIIASLVEREAKLSADRPTTASVILNRLKIGMKLDIDATIQYALGYQSKEKSWWKKQLTSEDLDIDSPFNTYKNPGLPPNPIANPGLAVLQAVTEAPDTGYLYYVSDSTGKLHFAKTIEEHNANIAKYIN